MWSTCFHEWGRIPTAVWNIPNNVCADRIRPWKDVNIFSTAQRVCWILTHHLLPETNPTNHQIGPCVSSNNTKEHRTLYSIQSTRIYCDAMRSLSANIMRSSRKRGASLVQFGARQLLGSIRSWRPQTTRLLGSPSGTWNPVKALFTQTETVALSRPMCRHCGRRRQGETATAKGLARNLNNCSR